MSSNPNRSRVLLGFSAIVAVAIVAILLWPANFRKEDASGAIGAVQKHHAPQITQQDVILGGESVKHQQQVLSTDFLADAGKLRAIGSSHDVAAARLFSQELAMRYMRAAREAVDAASRIQDARLSADLTEINTRLANNRVFSNEEMQAFSRQLGLIIVVCSRENAAARLDAAEGELAHINLADEQLAAKQVADVEQAFNRVDANISLNDEAQYLAMLEMESRLVGDEQLAQRANDQFELAARQLEQRASQNVEMAAAREENMNMRCARALQDVEAAANRTSANRAGMVASEEQLSARLGALAQRLNQRQAFAKEVVAMRAQRGQLDARQSN